MKKSSLGKNNYSLANILFLILLSFLTTRQDALAETKVDSALTMNLSVYSAKKWTDTKSHPIHLTLSIYNDSARSQDEVNRNNKKMLAAYREDGSLKLMNEKLREKLVKSLGPAPVEAVQLGRKDLPLKDWFEWKIVDKTGKSVEAQVDILAIDKDENPVLSFDQHECKYINFGIEPDQLKNLTAGIYSIEVNLSNKVLSTGKVSKAKSNSVELKLVSSKKSSSAMTYGYGLFYILDRNYDQAMVYANELLKVEPNSLGGNALLSRILTGKKQWLKAKPALEKYISLYEKKFGKDKHGYHPPVYYQLLLAMTQKNLNK